MADLSKLRRSVANLARDATARRETAAAAGNGYVSQADLTRQSYTPEARETARLSQLRKEVYDAASSPYVPVSRAIEESNARARYSAAKAAADRDAHTIGDIYSGDFSAREEERQRREENRARLDAAEELMRRLGLENETDPTPGERAKNVLTGAAKSSAAGFTNAAATAYDALGTGYQKSVEALTPVSDWIESRVIRPLFDAAQTQTPANVDLSQIPDYGAQMRGGIEALQNIADRLAGSSAADVERARQGASGLGRLLVDAGVSGAQMLGDAAINALAPGAGLAAMGIRAAGSGAQQARQAGGTLGQQLLYGGAVGGVEVLTEKMFDGLAGIYGAGGADEIVEKVIQKLAKSGGGQTALRLLSNAAGEGLEEVVSGVIDPGLEAIYDGQSVFSHYDSDTASDILHDALVGAVLGGIGGSVEIARTAAAVQNPADAGRDSRAGTSSPRVPPSGLPAGMENDGVNVSESDTTGNTQQLNRGETASIVNKLRSNIPNLERTRPVASVSTSALQSVEGRTMAEKARRLFDQIKGVVTRPGFGDVEINTRSIKDDLSHGIGPAKASVISSIPDVIQRGQQIDFQENWKGRPYDGYVFAAPVMMDDQPVYVAAVVKRTSKNRLYLHEVVDSNGNIIKISNGESANQTSLAAKSDAGTQSPLPDTIPQAAQSVKPGQAANPAATGRGAVREGTDTTPAQNGVTGATEAVTGVQGAQEVNRYAREQFDAGQLGSEGIYALSGFYNGDEDAMSYIQQMTRAYNAGREGLSLEAAAETPALNDAQRRAAWQAGRDDGVNVSDSDTTGNAVSSSDASLVNRMRETIPQLRDADVVSVVTGNEIPAGGKIVDRLMRFVQSIGNKVTRPGFGDVLFSRGKIKSSMIGHGVGNAKIETFAAVPDVIKNGRQIDYRQNWKGRGYDTYTFMAPVEYRGRTTYLGVVVAKDIQSGRYYVHEVIDENGDLLFRNNENAGDASDGRVTRTGTFDTVTSPAIEPSARTSASETPTVQSVNAMNDSADTIPQAARPVKPDASGAGIDLGGEEGVGRGDIWIADAFDEGPELTEEWTPEDGGEGEKRPRRRKRGEYTPEGERLAREARAVRAELPEALKQPMTIDVRSAHALGENWNAWKTAHKGEISLSINGKGRSVQEAYAELSGAHPDFFPPGVTNPADMVRTMLDAAERAEWTEKQFDASRGAETIDEFVAELTRESARFFASGENGRTGTEAPDIDTPEGLAAGREELDDYWALAQGQARRIANEENVPPEDLVSAETRRRKKSAREQTRDAWSYFKRKMVDSGEAVDRIGKATGDAVLYPYYNMARASTNAAASMITDAATDIRGKRTGKGLNDIFKPIRAQGAEYYNDFQMYLFHAHNVDRMSRYSQADADRAAAVFEDFRRENPELNQYADYQIEQMAADPNSIYQTQAQDYVRFRDAMRQTENTKNKPVFGYNVTAADSEAEAARLLRENPEFEELAEEVYGYIDNLLRYRVDSGLIAEKDYEALKRIYPHYVPTFRVFEQSGPGTRTKGRVQIGKTVGKAVGGKERLMPLHEALARQTMSVVREGSKNRFGTRLLNTVEKGARAGSAKVKNLLRDQVHEISDYTGDFSADTFDDLENREAPFRKTNTFVVRDNGKIVEMTVSPALYEAVQTLSPDAKESSAFTKVVRKGNDLFKRLVTGYNPVFLVRNFVRDLQDTGLYSKDLSEFAKNFPQAYAQIAKDGEYWQTYKALGGTYSSIFDYETGTVREGNWFKRNVAGRVETLNEAVEQAPRLAEFMATVKQAGGLETASMDALMQAMYNAADVTVNFGRSGTLGKVLNANYIPFLNPGIQGFDKMIRTVTETKGFKNWLRLAAKAALFGFAPAVVNGLLYGDDDEWDELKKRDRDIYYLFKLKEGLWLKLPKGRTLSVLGMTADRAMDIAKGKRVDWGEFIQTAASQTAPANPLEENILRAWFDADLLNRESPGRTWYGTDIESQRLQNLAPGQRYDARTDAVSKWLGEKLGLSPKKINYLLDQYSGVVGDAVLPLLTPTAERDMFSAAFTLDSTASNRLSNDFYDTSDKLLYAKNALGASAADQLVYTWWNKQNSAVSEVNKAIREIEADENLSGKEKKDLLHAQYGIRNTLERQALGELELYRAAAETALDALDRPNRAFKAARSALTGTGLLDEEGVDDAMRSLLGSLGVSYNALYAAYSGGDAETYNALYRDMTGSGVYSDDNIRKNMDKLLRADAGVSSVKELEQRYLHPDEQTRYDRTMTRVQRSDLWRDAGQETRDKAAEWLYNLAVGNSAGQSMQEKIDGGAAYGLDETEYILYLLARSMYDADGNGSYNQTEVQNAIDAIPGLSQEEKRYLFAAQNSGWKKNPYWATKKRR